MGVTTSVELKGERLMAWKVGNFLVAEGASVGIEFNWQGKYKGTQFALARPLLDLGPILGNITGERTVITTNHGLTARRGNEVTSWIYQVIVQNPNTDAVVFFDLTGGEVAPGAK